MRATSGGQLFLFSRARRHRIVLVFDPLLDAFDVVEIVATGLQVRDFFVGPGLVDIVGAGDQVMDGH